MLDIYYVRTANKHQTTRKCRLELNKAHFSVLCLVQVSQTQSHKTRIKRFSLLNQTIFPLKSNDFLNLHHSSGHQKARYDREGTSSMEGGKSRRLEEDNETNLDRTPSPILERSSSALLDRGKRSLTTLLSQQETLKNLRLKNLIEPQSSTDEYKICPQDRHKDE